MEHKRAIVKAGAFEAILYFLGAQAISFAVGEDREPLFGLWTIPITFLMVGILYIALRLLPSLKAHQDHFDWRGAEYEMELKEELKTRSYSALLRRDWFIRHLRQKEKENPPTVKKFIQ